MGGRSCSGGAAGAAIASIGPAPGTSASGTTETIGDATSGNAAEPGVATAGTLSSASTPGATDAIGVASSGGAAGAEMAMAGTVSGASAIVVSAYTRQAAAIFAPFSSSSTVQIIPLAQRPQDSDGFEDVGISADSQIAILTGNSTTDPAVFIRAPFGETSVTGIQPILGVDNPARGNGAVRAPLTSR